MPEKPTQNPADAQSLVGYLHAPEGVSVEDAQSTVVWMAELVERYKLLRSQIAEIRAKDGTQEAKKYALIFAVIQFLHSDEAAREAGDHLLLLDLLGPEAAKEFTDIARANIAVAAAAPMEGQ